MLVFGIMQKQSKDKIDETYIRPASVEFTAKDTSSIDSLVKMFVQYANNGDLSNASSMLHIVEKVKLPSYQWKSDKSLKSS